MNWNGRTVLVTGADGFIGSHLVERLVREGARVRAFVLYNSFSSWGWLDHCAEDIRGKFEIFQGDVRDPNGVREAMKSCDYVFHLAALIAIPYSYHSPDTYVDTNVRGTLNILQAAKELSVKRVLHTSTSEVYGTAQFVPIDETHPLIGQSPYSASKIGADQMAIAFHRSFELPVVIVRPFNTYGPRQSARAVIPTVISQVLNGANTIELGALHPTRDFSFVDDTVSGFLELADCEGAIGEVINLGSGFEISIGQTAELICQLSGRDIEIRLDRKRLRPTESEVERLFSSTEKMRQLTNWSPKFEGFEGFKSGLKETMQWFSNKENLGFYKHDTYNI